MWKATEFPFWLTEEATEFFMFGNADNAENFSNPLP
jgi:hypothetical protein